MLSEKQPKELGIENWSALAKDFNEPYRLFNYASLFQEFLQNCEPREHKIFGSFKTNNFERIQEILIDAKRVNEPI